MAVPLEFQERTWIVELIKEITQNITVNSYKEDTDLVGLMNRMDDNLFRDELTGAYNRRYINKQLLTELQRAYVGRYPVTVMITDIDYFKNVNDTYGHTIGDKILVAYVNILQTSMEHYDGWVARLGGDEFLICLLKKDTEKSYKIAHKLRSKIEKYAFYFNGLKIQLTASFGICVNDHSTNEEQMSYMIQEADEKLYKAKRAGRNLVV